MSVRVRPYKRGGLEVDISLTWPDGSTYRERKRAPVTSKSGARRWGEERVRALLLQGPPKVIKEVPTLAGFESRYMNGYARANRQKHSTIKAKESIFRAHLIPKLGNKRLDRITPEDVQQLKASLAKHHRKTTNNVLCLLNHMLSTAVEWNVLEKMPCTIKLGKVSATEMTFFESEQYERLISAAHALDARTHIAVLLGGDAGLRVGEVIALEQSDIDYRRNYLSIQRAEYVGVVDLPKGGRSRRIPMTKRLAAALHAHRHLRGDRVLYRDDGTTTTSKLLSVWLKKAERRAGLPVRGATHTLRHTFCSQLAMRGAPARAIQELAGHKDLTTTQRYMHLSPAAIESAVRLLESAPVHVTSVGDILETAPGR